MLGEFLPESEKPKTPNNRLAQGWVRPEFMEQFSKISEDRRQELREGAGDIALGLSEQQEDDNPFLTVTGAVAPLLLPVAMPEIQAVVVLDELANPLVDRENPENKKNPENLKKAA